MLQSPWIVDRGPPAERRVHIPGHWHHQPDARLGARIRHVAPALEVETEQGTWSGGSWFRTQGSKPPSCVAKTGPTDWKNRDFL